MIYIETAGIIEAKGSRAKLSLSLAYSSADYSNIIFVIMK